MENTNELFKNAKEFMEFVKTVEEGTAVRTNELNEKKYTYSGA